MSDTKDDLLVKISLQLARIQATLKSGPVHASGPKKPTLAQLESRQ